MKPLILEFAEKPKVSNFNYSHIEYSKSKNLSVIRGSDIPAITYLNMETETFTHASTEPSDSDRDVYSIKHLMETYTVTESIEPTDSDR